MGPQPAQTKLTRIPGPNRSFLVHGGLFLLTFASAAFAQLPLSRYAPFGEALVQALMDPQRLNHALVFAGTLMGILLCHEMGHYLVAQRHAVEQSLPYFIPAPTLLGTLGAIIVIRDPPRTRSVLLRVAVAGPWAGLVPALIACAWGLAHSQPVRVSTADFGHSFVLGSSVLFEVLRHAFGPTAQGLALHPVAFAGWVGLFVTTLNLIPAAQLDGGHIAYALYGAKQVSLGVWMVLALALCGVAMALFPTTGSPWGGAVWLLWAVLLVLIGVRHPDVRQADVILSRPERGLGYGTLLLFALTFVPAPLGVVNRAKDLRPTDRIFLLTPPDPGHARSR